MLYLKTTHYALLKNEPKNKKKIWFIQDFMSSFKNKNVLFTHPCHFKPVRLFLPWIIQFTKPLWIIYLRIRLIWLSSWIEWLHSVETVHSYQCVTIIMWYFIHKGTHRVSIVIIQYSIDMWSSKMSLWCSFCGVWHSLSPIHLITLKIVEGHFSYFSECFFVTWEWVIKNIICV